MLLAGDCVQLLCVLQLHLDVCVVFAAIFALEKEDFDLTVAFTCLNREYMCVCVEVFPVCESISLQLYSLQQLYSLKQLRPDQT